MDALFSVILNNFSNACRRCKNVQKTMDVAILLRRYGKTLDLFLQEMNKSGYAPKSHLETCDESKVQVILACVGYFAVADELQSKMFPEDEDEDYDPLTIKVCTEYLKKNLIIKDEEGVSRLYSELVREHRTPTLEKLSPHFENIDQHKEAAVQQLVQVDENKGIPVLAVVKVNVNDYGTLTEIQKLMFLVGDL